MKNWLETSGTIVFDVENKTAKHKKQASWKKHVIVMMNDNLSDYYGWFIKQRYNVVLNKPLRGPHYTIVNDRGSDLSNWDKVKSKYNNTRIKVYYNIDMRSNSEHWWLKAYSPEGDQIRKELNLGSPFYAPHITIGLVNNKNQMASDYALRCEKRYGNFNKIKDYE